MAKRIIGIDFGTSSTFMKVKRYENGRPAAGGRLDFKPVIFDSGSGSAALSTVIQTVGEGAEKHSWFGVEAEALRPGCKVYRNFKVELECPDAAKRVQARALVEQLFAFLYQKYQEQRQFLGEAEDEEETIVSYPAKWSAETQRFMVETAKKAGFPHVSGMDEASASIGAALIQKEEELKRIGVLQGGRPFLFLVADMGAGTTDLAVCRYTPGTRVQNEIIATWPGQESTILFGGQEIDKRIAEYFADRLKEDGLPEQMAQSVPAQQLDKVKEWKERTLSDTLNRGESISYCSFLMPFYTMLGLSPAPFTFGRPEFEKLLERYLRQFPELIQGCLENTKKKLPGFQERNIELVILTGGHSQWYFVQEMLAGALTKFGSVGLPGIASDQNRLLAMPRPQEIVSLGLVYQPMVAQQASVPQSQTSPAKQVKKSGESVVPAVKPIEKQQSPAAQKWKCGVCGYLHGGEQAPEVCPACKARGVLFDPVEQSSPPQPKPAPDVPAKPHVKKDGAKYSKKDRDLTNINRQGIAAWFQGMVYFIGREGRIFKMPEEGGKISPVTPEGDIYEFLYASKKWLLGVKVFRDTLNKVMLKTLNIRLFGANPCIIVSLGGKEQQEVTRFFNTSIDMLKIADETVLYVRDYDRIYAYKLCSEEKFALIGKCSVNEEFPIINGSLHFRQLHLLKDFEYFTAKWDKETGFSCTKEIGEEHSGGEWEKWKEPRDEELKIPETMQEMRTGKYRRSTRIGKWVYFKPYLPEGAEDHSPCSRIRIDGTGTETLM